MGKLLYFCDISCVNIPNLSGNVWIRHVSAGEEPMIHGQEGHNGNLQALGLCGAWWYGELVKKRDLFSQDSLRQAPWLHIVWISHGWQDKLRAFNLDHAMNKSEGKELRQADWRNMRKWDLTCPKISASSSPKLGIMTEWDGWMLTLICDNSCIDAYNSWMNIRWNFSLQSICCTYPGDNFRQGRHP